MPEEIMTFQQRMQSERLTNELRMIALEVRKAWLEGGTVTITLTDSDGNETTRTVRRILPKPTP